MAAKNLKEDRQIQSKPYLTATLGEMVSGRLIEVGRLIGIRQK